MSDAVRCRYDTELQRWSPKKKEAEIGSHCRTSLPGTTDQPGTNGKRSGKSTNYAYHQLFMHSTISNQRNKRAEVVSAISWAESGNHIIRRSHCPSVQFAWRWRRFRQGRMTHLPRFCKFFKHRRKFRWRLQYLFSILNCVSGIVIITWPDSLSAVWKVNSPAMGFPALFWHFCWWMYESIKQNHEISCLKKTGKGEYSPDLEIGSSKSSGIPWCYESHIA